MKVTLVITETGCGMDTGDFSKLPYTITLRIGRRVDAEHCGCRTLALAREEAVGLAGYLEGCLNTTVEIQDHSEEVTE